MCISPWSALRTTAGAVAALAFLILTHYNRSRADERLDVQRQIADLGSSDFAVRQRATVALEEAGPEVIPHVAMAAASTDAEVRSRGQAILLSHALSPRREQRTAARQALEALAGSSLVRPAQVARETLQRVREVASSAASAELTRLGATVQAVLTGEPLTFNVQVRASWSGRDERLALLADLGEVPWLSVENAPVTDAALDHIARLGGPQRGLAKLYLGASRIEGLSLEKLAPLVRLQYLSLRELPIDDARLAKLPDFPELQYLGLDGTRISDAGLAHVARYTGLQVLWLDNTSVSDRGLAHLKSLTNLRTLYLPGTRVAGPGLAELRHLPSLTSISLKGAKLAPDGLKYVAQLEQLESLGLDQTNVTDDQLAELTGLHRLRILWLSSTQVSDAGVEHLQSLRGLQIVHLSDTDVSQEAARELQRALPNCQVTMVRRPDAAPQQAVPARSAP
jgi:hypothetical protein